MTASVNLAYFTGFQTSGEICTQSEFLCKFHFVKIIELFSAKKNCLPFGLRPCTTKTGLHSYRRAFNELKLWKYEITDIKYPENLKKATVQTARLHRLICAVVFFKYFTYQGALIISRLIICSV